jgi:hypothetical protein
VRKVCEPQQQNTLQDGEAGQEGGGMRDSSVALTEISSTPINQNFEILFFKFATTPQPH